MILEPLHRCLSRGLLIVSYLFFAFFVGELNKLQAKQMKCAMAMFHLTKNSDFHRRQLIDAVFILPEPSEVSC
jgi:hypothetical protein